MERVFAAPVDLNSFAFTQTFPTFGSLVSVILKNAFVIAGIIAFLLLVFGGFTVIIGAGGDSKKLEQGKQAMTGAAAGLLLIVTAVWIVQIIEKVTGLSLF
jgi:hypothetical protein